MNLSDYTSYDGVGLAKLVRSGAVSRADLIDAANQAMDAVNPSLNAVIGRVDPPVYALGADQAPFAGVPFLVKDLSHGWAGIQCDMGSRLARGYVPKSHTEFARRLKSSGLVVTGRTNTPEFGANGVTEPVLHGATHNPWDAARSPGGSSGGAAAAVAAGIVPFAHASDAGGSIRVPAAWCGLVGLKPTRGRNPMGPDACEAGRPVSAHHVVSRTVRDTAAVLDVTSGPAAGDFVPLMSPGPSFLSAAELDPEPLRIALCTRLNGAPEPEHPCVEAALAAAKMCEGLGHHVDEAVPEIDYQEIASLCFNLYAPPTVSLIERMAAAMGRTPGEDTLEPQTLATFTKGGAITAPEMIASLNKLSALSAAMSGFMQNYDVLLTPGVSRVPCMTGEFSPADYDPDDVSFWDKEMECYTFSPLPSITGQPALVLPLYWTVSGLPVGAQLIGGFGADATVLSLAGQLERTHPWADKRPPIHAAND